jgi:hypothetical protein
MQRVRRRTGKATAVRAIRICAASSQSTAIASAQPIESFLADDVDWDIRYLVIATRDWWPGKHVQLAPFAVKDIDWTEHRVNVDVTRAHVKSSPAWDPLALEDQVCEQQLHRHFGWPGYGWQR